MSLWVEFEGQMYPVDKVPVQEVADDILLEGIPDFFFLSAVSRTIHIKDSLYVLVARLPKDVGTISPRSLCGARFPTDASLELVDATGPEGWYLGEDGTRHRFPTCKSCMASVARSTRDGLSTLLGDAS